MSTQRTHHVTTTDGVTIGGTVHGRGRPLVFLHGAIGDGDLDWGRLVGHLTGRFTCHLPSMRGRGLSGDHPDLSPGRQVDDVLAYLDSLGEPAGLVGWSAGANLALGAAARSGTPRSDTAARSGAVDAVVLLEPPMRGLMDGRELAVIVGAIARMGELAAGGDVTAAIRAFAGGPFSDEELAVAEEAGYFEAAGRYVPHLLSLLGQVEASGGPTVEDPAVLGAVSTPVLVLYGSGTMAFYRAGARHVAGHVRDGRMREIPGAGHAAPLTHPEALAEAITRFFGAG
ncbi:alpha/beta fold hydrolase [Nonomuraea ferruginea]|uniref:Alpha/beta hydrolase n=1 Tax=Nonomuraea ferruginea TaxID=46174 RepID=A0ABT4SYV5_9ACTN|nr:alpha/beta hydrolase [Nonomuraea ferruginea]MDA0642433.1 alpha/beta hydrolase [Nonomuraea ferruginea]